MHLESITIKVRHFRLHPLLKYLEYLKDHIEFVGRKRGKFQRSLPVGNA